MLLVVLSAIMSILVLVGCNNKTVAEPTEPQRLPDYKLYWNVDKNSYNGDSDRRKAELDGTILMRLCADGEIVECKVPGRAAANQIDTYYLVGLTFDENGNGSQVLNINTLPVQLLSDEFYAQSVDVTSVHINSIPF